MPGGKDSLNRALQGLLERVVALEDGGTGGGGGVIVSDSAPEGDSSMLWIDTSNGGVAKYYNGTAWTNVAAVWG